MLDKEMRETLLYKYEQNSNEALTYQIMNLFDEERRKKDGRRW